MSAILYSLDRQTDRRTDRQIDRQTDIPSLIEVSLVVSNKDFVVTNKSPYLLFKK